MFFPPLVISDGETQKLKKLNHHSFFGKTFYHWLSGHCKKFLVLFAQDLSKFSKSPGKYWAMRDSFLKVAKPCLISLNGGLA